MPSRTQNVSQHLLTKPSYAIEDTKFILTCFDETHPMPARTQNISQNVLTRQIPWQQGHKMHLNKCLPFTFHASKDTKCISIYFDKSHPMPAGT